MQKIIIAAASENGVIGKNGTMPWHIPKELQIFKEITYGSPLIMGRKTFNSLPKMLPGRPHIVLTRNRELLVQPASIKKSDDNNTNTQKKPEYSASWQEAFTCCEKHSTTGKLFIIGGAKIFEEGLRYADTLRLTKVHLKTDGDCFFPVSDGELVKEFTETARHHYPASSQQEVSFTIIEYHKR